MRRYVVVTLLFILCSSPSELVVQQTEARSRAEWWINIPSSPLEFRLFPNKRFLGLANRSTGRVVEFTLGCVTQDGDKVRMVHQATATKTDLASNSASGKQLYFKDVSAYAQDRECCNKATAKLAVVRVTFADGSTWKVEGDFSPCPVQTVKVTPEQSSNSSSP